MDYMLLHLYEIYSPNQLKVRGALYRLAIGVWWTLQNPTKDTPLVSDRAGV